MGLTRSDDEHVTDPTTLHFWAALAVDAILAAAVVGLNWFLGQAGR